ncbi:FAD-binding oxidoreductase [Ferrimonas balearica]|uniref:FAD-binding oxidoreductase n=1 Tax=Ferrimonas balearica TaxID=44012 RepID=UPI001C995EB0|nr:FAD-binding oxidoreductase [Ferrimonas balearica]MBY5922002.1 FAD-binding oxidoreductase [Ferrimonas balearica]MBY5994658.1 FAD-binding oxidoreductase [Ferrimonas balearica]
MHSNQGLDLTTLSDHFSGPLITPDHPEYDTVRQLWNAMADKRPALIARCQNEEDIQAALAFARTHDLEIALRGAGHNIAGNASCNGGILIDLSLMTKVTVDRENRIVHAEPGATLGDIDAASQAHGLAVPLGINSTTGIAGLTLGGGFGWLTRRFGMTVDALTAARVVGVDGDLCTASVNENNELFWALRGGGGNFGVVSRFDFSAYPVGPEVFAGLVVFPFEQASQVLNRYRSWILTTPETFNTWVVIRHAPPLPFLDPSVHGTKVVVMAVCHSGDIAEGDALAQTLQSFGEPVGAHLGPMPYVDWQQAFDPLLTPGARNYWKTHNFTEMTEELVEVALDYGEGLPGPECEVFFAVIAGAANRIAPDATAWGARDARFVMNVHARWQDAADDERCIEWARALFRATASYASAGAYVNFMTEEEGGRVEDAYMGNFARLKAVKQQYDPDNLLHLNQNIRPD